MNNHNRDFKGIWIPKEVWLSEDLTMQEKLFFVEINSLDNDRGCFANNEYFANFFWISKTRVSEVINSLVAKWYISSTIENSLGNQRILKTLLKESLRGYTRKVEEGLKEKFKHNNTVNNTSNNIYFEQFWKEYPKKVAKDAAYKAYEKAIKRAAPQDILDWLIRYKKHTMSQGKYAPSWKYAQWWLNDSRWTDEYEDVTPTTYQNKSDLYRKL